MLREPTLALVRCLLEAGLTRITFQNVLGVFGTCGLVEPFCPLSKSTVASYQKNQKKTQKSNTSFFITDGDFLWCSLLNSRGFSLLALEVNWPFPYFPFCIICQRMELGNNSWA